MAYALMLGQNGIYPSLFIFIKIKNSFALEKK